MRSVITGKLLEGATSVANGTASGPVTCGKKTVQARVVGTGAVSATVELRVSNDNLSYLLAATFTLSGTTSDSDGFFIEAPWAYFRADVTAISGTGAAVTVTVGE